MWSAIFPELMSITVFVLTILCLQAGNSPTYLQDYAILSANTTGLKANYNNITNAGLPIHDVYNLYMRTHCRGYYQSDSAPPLGGVKCSMPSPNSKFLPGSLILNDLKLHHSDQNLTSISFPREIQDAFKQQFNQQLHVAFIFYAIALVWIGVVIAWGLACLVVGPLGTFAWIFALSASTCLLISSTIVTAVQSQATALINDNGNIIGVSASFNQGFLTLTWSAFGLNSASIVVWTLAGVFSLGYRGLKVLG